MIAARVWIKSNVPASALLPSSDYRACVDKRTHECPFAKNAVNYTFEKVRHLTFCQNAR